MNTQLSINLDQSSSRPASSLPLPINNTDAGSEANGHKWITLPDFGKPDFLSSQLIGDLNSTSTPQSLSRQSEASASAHSSALSSSSSSQSQDCSKKKDERAFIKSTFLNQRLIDLHKELLGPANTAAPTYTAAQASHSRELERSSSGKTEASTLPLPTLPVQTLVVQTAESNTLPPSPLALAADQMRSLDRSSASRNFGYLQPTSSQSSSSASSLAIAQLVYHLNAHQLNTRQTSLPVLASSSTAPVAITSHPLKDQIVTLAKQYVPRSHNQLTSPFTLVKHAELISIIQQTKDAYTLLQQQLVHIQKSLSGLVPGSAPSVQTPSLATLPAFDRLIAIVQQEDQEHIKFQQQLLERDAAINLLLHFNDSIAKERDNYKNLYEKIALLFQQNLQNVLQSTQVTR